MNCIRCGHDIEADPGRCAQCGLHWTPNEPTMAVAGRALAGGANTIASDLDPDVTRLGSGMPPLFTDADLTRLEGGSASGAPAARQFPTGVPRPAGVPEQGPLAVGQAFGGRYHIVTLLGLGGMGAVYQAWDDELAVVVALKVTRPEIAADPEAARLIERRFKQELLLARQVTHKNVVRIHDLGEVNGIKYITMPYVEGEDLSSILDREGELPLPRALKIARSLISGLSAAHAAGVIHRDLKPANVMIDAEGEALLTDFGIARSTGAPAPPMAPVGLPGMGQRAAPAEHTVMGAVVGTIGYMAPEQAQAQPVDQRADIYATGLILYDMLGGRARFARAESAIAELTSRTLAAPPPLHATNPAVPESIDRVINRCLQPNPAARYQTTTALAEDLDRIDDTGKMRRKRRPLTPRLAAGAAAVVLALLTLTWWLARGTAPPVQPPPVSVLIADFENKTGEQVFTGAVEQALSIAIEGASFISSYPRPNARQVADQIRKGAQLDETTAELVAKREAVNIVLAGTIERDGSRYRISARALDAAQPEDTPRVIASSATVARSRDDVLAAIGRLAGDLRERLGDTAASTTSAPSDTFTASSLEAMRAYVRGQDLQVAGRFADALAAYQEAVTIDPNFGRAYAGLGVTYGNLKQPAKSEESYQQAFKHLDRMTEREQYATLGGYYLLVSHDYEKAVENYEALVSRYPADRGGHANLALAYLNRHQTGKALAEVRKALELEPGNVLQRMNYAMYALYASDFPTAIAESRKIPPASGLYPYALFTEGRAAAAAGDVTAADSAFSRLDALGTRAGSLPAMARADLAMYQGKYAAALAVLQSAGTPGAAPDQADVAARSIMIAEAQHALGHDKDAASTIGRALAASRDDETLVPAAWLLIDLGDLARAESIARDLDNRLQPQSRAYAGLITGALALRAGRLPAALDALRDARQRLDSWLVHVPLGQTYLAAGQAPEAVAEFETCVKRQGEATDLFFSNAATLRYMAQARYWLARAQEALGNPGARGHYEFYVKLRGGTDARDPLLADARLRLAKPGH